MYIKFGGGVTLLFVVLKLLHVIQWKLRWVLAPLWIPIVLFVVLAVVLHIKDKLFG